MGPHPSDLRVTAPVSSLREQAASRIENSSAQRTFSSDLLYSLNQDELTHRLGSCPLFTVLFKYQTVVSARAAVAPAITGRIVIATL